MISLHFFHKFKRLPISDSGKIFGVIGYKKCKVCGKEMIKYKRLPWLENQWELAEEIKNLCGDFE